MGESILQEAERIIHGARRESYGSPAENFGTIADMFTAYQGGNLADGGLVSPYDVICMMIIIKIARLKSTGYHRDSVVDIAGYAGCLELLYNETHPKHQAKSPEDESPEDYEFLSQVPADVYEVLDNDGDCWCRTGTGWSCATYSGYTFSGEWCGPFTVAARESKS